MAELSLEITKRQFDKFAAAYNALHKTNFVWDCVNPIQNDNWDFRGRDESSGEFLHIQHTEAIVNQKMKGKLEIHRKGEYEFEFLPTVKFATDAVEEAYMRELKMADENVILLVSFHDFDYERDRRFDGIKEIRIHIKRKFKSCAFRELWIINLPPDPSCDFIF